jgi:L-fuculose-phosphate aldolase
MPFSLLHPRDQLVATMRRIYGHAMTTTSGGNLSVRDANGDVWITPARVDKGRLGREDIVCLRPDGTREGRHPPSSEWPFHLGIYAARPEVRAVIHAHPGALVSFSICGRVPDTRLFPEAWNVCGEVAMAPYALPGSRALGESIASCFAAPERPSCVMLENHGVVVAGEDLVAAFRRFETLEFTAQTILNASQLGAVAYLEAEGLELARAAGKIPAGTGSAREASSREKELRWEICQFVHRAYEHRLMTSAWGSYSARLGEDCFVITPRGVDRHDLSHEDLVVVRDGRVEGPGRPSRATRFHRAIYQAHPEIQSVVNALPRSATAFCVSDEILDTRTIPESYLFLKDVHAVPFSDQFGEAAAQRLGQALGPARPIALLRHNGALVAGRSVLAAFDRLEVLEATAAALISARALGPVQPMGEAVIAELLRAFPGV